MHCIVCETDFEDYPETSTNTEYNSWSIIGS